MPRYAGTCLRRLAPEYAVNQHFYLLPTHLISYPHTHVLTINHRILVESESRVAVLLKTKEKELHRVSDPLYNRLIDLCPLRDPSAACRSVGGA